MDNEDLVLTLEAIVEKFEDEMAPFAVGLTQHLAAAFWRATAAEVPALHCMLLAINEMQQLTPMLIPDL